MENFYKRREVKIVTKWNGRHGAEALISRPTFYSVSIFDDELLTIQIEKTEVYLSKPIYVGFCVLNIFKSCLYEFHYNYMKLNLQDKCKLCPFGEYTALAITYYST